MKLFNLSMKYPVLAYAMFCLAFGLLASGIPPLGSYNNGGVGFVGIILLAISAMVAFPFSIPMELGAGHLIGTAAGLSVCVFGEIMLQLIKRCLV